MKQVETLSRQDLRKLSVVQPGLEIIDWWLYDTLTVQNGGSLTTFTFFQQAVGGAGITLETTNQEIPGQLPSGHKYVAQKIILEALPALAGADAASPDYVKDALAVTHQGYSTFNIGTRPYFQMPTKNLVGGNLQGFASAGGGVAANAQLNYAQSRTIVNGEMEYSPVIPANYSFNVQNVYPAAPTVSADLRVRCQIIGKLIRPRQG